MILLFHLFPGFTPSPLSSDQRAPAFAIILPAQTGGSQPHRRLRLLRVWLYSADNGKPLVGFEQRRTLVIRKIPPGSGPRHELVERSCSCFAPRFGSRQWRTGATWRQPASITEAVDKSANHSHLVAFRVLPLGKQPVYLDRAKKKKKNKASRRCCARHWRSGSFLKGDSLSYFRTKPSHDGQVRHPPPD